MANQLLEEHRDRIETLLASYPEQQATLLPLLWIVQETYGYIEPDSIADVAEIADVTPTEVMECVTFYTMYHQEPVGKYHIRVCTTLPCALSGGEGLSEYLQEKLGIKADKGVSDDGLWSLENVECLGACIEAPMMLINDREYYQLTRAKVDDIVTELKKDVPETVTIS
jgi:NADH-quinone oxidoreductase E subunit